MRSKTGGALRRQQRAFIVCGDICRKSTGFGARARALLFAFRAAAGKIGGLLAPWLKPPWRGRGLRRKHRLKGIDLRGGGQWRQHGRTPTTPHDAAVNPADTSASAVP